MERLIIKTITVLGLVLISIIAFGQTKTDIETTLKKIEHFQVRENGISFISTFLTEFKEAANIESAEPLRLDNVGIGASINFETKKAFLLPIKFTNDFNDGKSAIIPIEAESSLEKLKKHQLYLDTYLSNPEAIKDNAYYSSLKYTIPEKKYSISYTTETVLKDDLYTHRFRIKGDWVYSLGISGDGNNVLLCKYYTKAIPRDDYTLIEMEKSRLKKQKINNAEREVYPLYHDVRVDDIRIAVYHLLKHEPYKSDAKLLELAKKITEPLNRKNVRLYTDELEYLINLKIDETFWKYKSDEVLNLKHTATHSLADIYLGLNMYDKAEQYFIQSLLKVPIYSNSGTIAYKDADRITYDISKIHKSNNQKDKMYSYLIPLLVSFNYSNLATSYISMAMKEYNEHKGKFKQDLDKSIATLKNKGNGIYSIVFRGNLSYFFRVFETNVKVFKEEMAETAFYRQL